MKVTSAIQVTIWDTFTMLKKILGFEVFDSVVRSFDHLILLLTKRNSWTVKYGKMKSKFYEFELRFSAKKNNSIHPSYHIWKNICTLNEPDNLTNLLKHLSVLCIATLVLT